MKTKSTSIYFIHISKKSNGFYFTNMAASIEYIYAFAQNVGDRKDSLLFPYCVSERNELIISGELIS